MSINYLPRSRRDLDRLRILLRTSSLRIALVIREIWLQFGTRVLSLESWPRRDEGTVLPNRSETCKTGFPSVRVRIYTSKLVASGWLISSWDSNGTWLSASFNFILNYPLAASLAATLRCSWVIIRWKWTSNHRVIVGKVKDSPRIPRDIDYDSLVAI